MAGYYGNKNMMNEGRWALGGGEPTPAGKERMSIRKSKSMRRSESRSPNSLLQHMRTSQLHHVHLGSLRNVHAVSKRNVGVAPIRTFIAHQIRKQEDGSVSGPHHHPQPRATPTLRNQSLTAEEDSGQLLPQPNEEQRKDTDRKLHDSVPHRHGQDGSALDGKAAAPRCGFASEVEQAAAFSGEQGRA